MEKESIFNIIEDEVVENDHLTKEDILLDADIVEEHSEEVKIEKPKNGMCFGSSEKIIEYYTGFARQEGFGVVRRNSINNDLGKLKYLTLSCSRQGRPLSLASNILKPNPHIRNLCKAKISAFLCPDGDYKLSSVCNEHNHALSPGKTRFFRCNKNLSQHVKKRLELNDQAGIRVNNNFFSLVVEAKGFENLPFGERDCRNHIDRVRRSKLEVGDAEALHQYFVRMRERNDGFYCQMDFDDDSRLRNVFWADARSRAAYESFGDAITFDTTYLTNKYKMPFAPFVGVNHHGHSILLGCGLIMKEDTESFIWLFNCWLACMSGRAPMTIMTDQDKAMQNAIEHVFPNTRHRWCIWHIMKKIPEKLSSYSRYEQIKTTIKSVVYNSLTHIEFEEKWTLAVKEFDLEDNEWLSGLYLERNRWVLTFVKNSFWAAMASTQRSESMNSFFDKYVNRKTTLKRFVEQYDNALRSKVEKEAHADYRSFHSTIPLITHYDIEKQFQEAYTIEKFEEIQEEFRKKMYCHPSLKKEEGTICSYEVTEEIHFNDTTKDVMFMVEFDEKDFEVRCMCQLFESRGILCRHIFVVLTVMRKIKEIPDKYFLRRWRKDLKRKHTLVKNCYDGMCRNPNSKRFDRLCNSFYEVTEIGAESDDKCKIIIDYIHELMNKLQNGETNVRGTQQSQNSDNIVAKEVSKMLSPIVVPNKKRQSTKRKESKVDQIVRKKVKKSKKDQKAKNKCTRKQNTENNKLGENRTHEFEDLAAAKNVQESYSIPSSYMASQSMPHMSQMSFMPHMDRMPFMPHTNQMSSPFMPHTIQMSNPFMPHMNQMISPYMPHMNQMSRPFMPHFNHMELLQMQADPKHNKSQSNLMNAEVFLPKDGDQV